MKILLFAAPCFALSCCLSSLALADVPVVELSHGISPNTMAATIQTEAGDQTASTFSTLSTDERVAHLEQQVSNLAQMNLPGKIDALQQQEQQLNGQVDVLSHNLQQLSDRLQQFYQDLDQRMNQNKAPSAATAPVAPSEQAAYQAAFGALQNKQYIEAATKLQAYLQAYPAGQYASNAHYWLGEVNYLQSHFKQAETEFQTVVDKYPTSDKLSDALLKLAIIHQNAGKHAQARQELQALKKRFPTTAAAQLATQQLQVMKN